MAEKKIVETPFDLVSLLENDVNKYTEQSVICSARAAYAKEIATFITANNLKITKVEEKEENIEK